MDGGPPDRWRASGSSWARSRCTTRSTWTCVPRWTRGDWHPGDQVPTERELAVRYGCSLITVRRALERAGARAAHRADPRPAARSCCRPASTATSPARCRSPKRCRAAASTRRPGSCPPGPESAGARRGGAGPGARLAHALPRAPAHGRRRAKSPGAGPPAGGAVPGAARDRPRAGLPVRGAGDPLRDAASSVRARPSSPSCCAAGRPTCSRQRSGSPALLVEGLAYAADGSARRVRPELRARRSHALPHRSRGRPVRAGRPHPECRPAVAAGGCRPMTRQQEVVAAQVAAGAAPRPDRPVAPIAGRCPDGLPNVPGRDVRRGPRARGLGVQRHDTVRVDRVLGRRLGGVLGRRVGSRQPVRGGGRHAGHLRRQHGTARPGGDPLVLLPRWRRRARTGGRGTGRGGEVRCESSGHPPDVRGGAVRGRQRRPQRPDLVGQRPRHRGPGGHRRCERVPRPVAGPRPVHPEDELRPLGLPRGRGRHLQAR